MAAEVPLADLAAGRSLEKGSGCPKGECAVEGRSTGNHISLLDVDDLKRRWRAITAKARKEGVIFRRPKYYVEGKLEPMVADLKNMAWESLEGGLGNRSKEEGRSQEKEDQEEALVKKIQIIPVITGQTCAPVMEPCEQKRKPAKGFMLLVTVSCADTVMPIDAEVAAGVMSMPLSVPTSSTRFSVDLLTDMRDGKFFSVEP
ncbi:uncharacterized protein LOC119292738 [Triticum dicoccoides]|uniref:uncharacterized protein LOC119292738 n=1 Tax=Triticum dicoccoides TaxID=85692 RepID=UPI00188F23BB|nr:uncharacterized protein LOC119292738 [Triticum dicoccoides]